MRLPFWAFVVMVLGSLLLENPTVAQPQEESKPLRNLTAGEIAKAKVSFELSTNVVEFADSLSDTIQDIHTFSESSKRLKALEAVSLVTKVLGPVMKLLQVFGAIFEMLSAFYLPSIGDTLKTEFGKVNRKLDALSLQLKNVGEELESSVKFHTWFSTYTDYKFKIMNGEEKLKQTMSQMEVVTDRRQKLRSAKEFTDHYKSQDIEGAMRNIFRLTAKDSTATQPNLFQLFSEEYKCNIEGLSRFMIVILQLAFSGSKQMSAFSFLTNKSQSDESLKAIYDEIENVKHQYEKQVWSCFVSAIRRAEKKTNDILTSHPEMTGTQLSSTIHSELSALVPWYNWSVVQYEQLLDVRQLGLPPVYIDLHCLKTTDVRRGQQFFFAEDNKRNILVMWEEGDTESHECHQITDTNTFMPFQLCKNCNADALQTSKDTLNGERCPNSIQSIFSRLCKDPNGLLKQALTKYTFLAVGHMDANHACQKDTCGGHGSCRTIPYTNHYMCLCHQYFFGRNCETRYNPADSLLASDIIANVRNNLGNFIGVPDVIDVYFELQNFSNQLQELQKNIEGLHEYGIKVTLYGDAFIKAEQVAEKYSNLLSGIISENNFGKDLEKLDLNFEDIFWNLKEVILGEGILVSEGILASLKKSQKSDFVCKENYKEKISRFMKDLLLLDEQVTEAQLRFLTWKLRNKDPSEEQDPLLQMGRIRDMAVARQGNYLKHWEENSCPELSADNLIENGCTKSLSYEGMRVNLNCCDGMTPSVLNVICQRVNGKLEWSAKPICQYVWGTWSSWSACSKTCGGGEKTRTRTKFNEESDTEVQKCETQDCCQPKYGKFKCKNGQCVSNSSVCDGYLNCYDGSDESEDRQCDYLRDGDTVALRNRCGGFMSCCAGYHGRNDIISTSDCPGDSVDRHDWTRCSNIEFRVDLINKGSHKGPKPILFGDEIKITSKRSGVCTNCQHHSYHWIIFSKGFGNVCRATEATTDRCKTKIFARNRLGFCDGYVWSGCKGEPIRHGDVLYFLQGDKWMGGAGVNDWVFRGTCPGSKITASTQCWCEQWTVFRR